MNCKNCGRYLNPGTVDCPKCGYHVPIKDVICDIFNNAKSIWGKELNNTNFFIYYIPRRVQKSVRENFGIDSDEQILYVRDTSVFFTGDEGLVMTDSAIYYIADNHKMYNKKRILWSDIESVKYQDRTFYFLEHGVYISNCFHCRQSCFIEQKSYPSVTDVANTMADIFTRIAKCVASNASHSSETSNSFSSKPNISSDFSALDKAIDKFCKLLELNKRDEALEYALECKKSIKSGIFFYHFISSMYIEKKEFQKAISICNEGLNLCGEESSAETIVNLLYDRYSAYYYLNSDTQVRKDSPLTENITNNTTCNNTSIKKDTRETISSFGNNNPTKEYPKIRTRSFKPNKIKAEYKHE